MQQFIQDFVSRQYMVTPDFEYFHYIDESIREVDYHNHDFYEAYFFISGKVTYIIEGRTYRLKPGDILLIHNNELHKPLVETGEKYERIVIWVNPQFLAKYSDADSSLSMCFESAFESNCNLLRPSADMYGAIKNILSKFERACNSLSFGSGVLKNAYLIELMVYLNKAYLANCNEETDIDINLNEKVDSIVKYINANITSRLSLDELSYKFYVSKYHLLREFKRYTGYTIHKFISQKRLIMARSLLRKGCRVNDVCSRCGFGEYSNFIRAFKKAYGISPGEYLKKAQGNNNILFRTSNASR